MEFQNDDDDNNIKDDYVLIIEKTAKKSFKSIYLRTQYWILKLLHDSCLNFQNNVTFDWQLSY